MSIGVTAATVTTYTEYADIFSVGEGLGDRWAAAAANGFVSATNVISGAKTIQALNVTCGTNSPWAHSTPAAEFLYLPPVSPMLALQTKSFQRFARSNKERNHCVSRAYSNGTT
jgi:hypothetical protein